MSEKIQQFLSNRQPATPCLVVDLDVVEQRYLALAAALPQTKIYYAVKANPAPGVLARLNKLGGSFDAASIHEIEQCLALGIPPERLAFGHPVKKERDIAAAYRLGVGRFAFDSEAELEKLVRAAPGASVFCRVRVATENADWPLTRKFGCDGEVAVALMVRAAEAGLDACGMSFHVGSQQRDPTQWRTAIAKVAMLYDQLGKAGVNPKLINIGGGFPARYRSDTPCIADYGREITAALADAFSVTSFGRPPPEIVVEPGRFIVADAGIIQTEIILIATRSATAKRRWVYLDIGRFGGLPEIMDECIEYRIRTPRDGGPGGPVVLAGPTCDEVDVLYDRAAYSLPLDLVIGDRIEILSTGAYTASYSSVGFNGFPPLSEYYI